MGLFGKGASKEDLDTYKKAKHRLEVVGKRDRAAGRRYETEAYLNANDKVIEAEKPIPWWQR